MIIAVDFDGTCVTHEYPNVGKEIGAGEALRLLQEKGHKFILFTMRSGHQLEDAIQWFNDNNISLFGVNENPEQRKWTTSPKPYAHCYIDDAALGCPLIFPDNGRPFVDWQTIMNSDWNEK